MDQSLDEKCLPIGWLRCTFGDIASVRNGYAFKSSDFKKSPETDHDVPLVRQSQLKSSFIDISEAVYLPRNYLLDHATFTIAKGDVIIGMSGSIGKVCTYVDDQPALQNQRTGKIQTYLKGEISPKFFGLYLSNIERQLVDFSKGVGVQNISAKDIEALAFNLPPRNEQHRIVAKIEELFSELDKGIESLKTAREQLKVYRQALLKHAFEGKLTAQWRKENRDKFETADALLKRIQTERAQRYQQELENWEAAGKQGSKPKAPKMLPPLTAEELAELPELPKGWGYVRVGTLIDDPVYGTSKKCDYEIAGVGVLRIPNVISGRIDSSDLKFAQFTEDEIATYKLKSGDILIIRSNGSVSIVGRCALVSDADSDFLCRFDKLVSNRY